MKRKVKKMAAMATSIIMAIMIILHSIPVLAGRIIYDNETGTHGGYDYELWKDYGNTIMELNDGGTFSCQWSNIGNALFRKGRKFNSDKTYQELGDIVVEYGCDYNPNGNSYLCVYGWTRNPLVEYYIVESWGSWRPPGATPKGTITVDGGTYEIYETTRVNQPSIDGTATFQQYWSVRTSKRTSGTISVTEHFKQWERMGMRMGKMYEVALTVEGYQSSGYANVYKNEIRIGANPTPAPSQSPIRRDAFSIIEAEEYNSTNSSTLQVIGTPNNGRGIGYIENGNTVTYSNIDFGSGATGFSATVATEVNTSIQIRSDSPTGTLLGTLYVSSTGSWNTYQTVSTNISKITGVHDIVLVFSGPVNVDNFIFSRSSPVPAPGDNTRDAYSIIQAEDYDSSYGPNLQIFSLPGGGSAIGYIENGYSTTYKNIDFGDGATSVTARVATQNATTIQVRLGSPSGTLLGTIYVGSTGSFDTYRDVSATISNTAGVKDIVLVFSGPVNVDWFVFSKSGT
ncbi:glycoside hydrolase family 11 protein [Thermoclostridium stercorarium]|uniref:carbohydrate-binding protein n=1 Tax=Thermoclostridium stercorarium TaxID=1510 RepID=UPI0022495700|nr:carbohydrate-binding protein [Thermoclostridium stercorarium]UZQ84890.1 glycoside hydrolase family 11 protein [Thermoclostridium stercorarium]